MWVWKKPVRGWERQWKLIGQLKKDGINIAHRISCNRESTGGVAKSSNAKVFFHISDAEMKANPKLTMTAAATAFNAKQQREDYQYQPKITVKDGKRVLTAKDYKVAYHNNTQKAVKEWLLWSP